MEGGRKPKLTSQISVLDPAKIRDLMKTREDHPTFRRNSSLAGLTVDAVLGGDHKRSTTTSNLEDNQQGRTLLDIICSDEDNSGAAYRGLVAQPNTKNGKKNTKKSIKDRLRLLRSSRPVPTCDIPISNGRNKINISNPSPPQHPKPSNPISSTVEVPAVIDAKQVDDPIVPCNVNEEQQDDKHEGQQQQPMSKNQEDDKHEEQQQQPVSKNQEDDKHEEQQPPMSKSQQEDDEKPTMKNNVDEPVNDADELEEEEEHQPISKNQEEEDESEEEEDEHEVLRNATSRLLISELKEVDDEIRETNKPFMSGMKEEDDDDEEEDDDQEEEEEPMKQVSLMALLEESMGAGDSEDEKEEEAALDIEDDVEVRGQYVCCVCMVRHNKGTCFSHCGHSFCRRCCKELYVCKGNCPRCNGYVMEIVEIF